MFLSLKAEWIDGFSKVLEISILIDGTSNLLTLSDSVFSQVVNTMNIGLC